MCHILLYYFLFYQKESIRNKVRRWNVSRTTIYRYLDKIDKTKTTTFS
ncbi:helix-turn-helix domain-containing protein [Enterococcus mundtii]